MLVSHSNSIFNSSQKVIHRKLRHFLFRIHRCRLSIFTSVQNSQVAQEKLKVLFAENPPYGAEVNFKSDKSADGWEAPALADWLEEAVETASSHYFKKPANYLGEGGSVSDTMTSSYMSSWRVHIYIWQ